MIDPVPPLVSAERVRKTFVQRDRERGAGPLASAVEDVTVSIADGEALGLVGESGSGKSTLGRMLLGLLEPSDGTVAYRGTDIWSVSADERRLWCARRQMVFQDPLSALNPRRTAGENIELPLINFGWARTARRRRVDELLTMVGLDPRHHNRYPNQFSGGQCQRIVIARAIALEPEFLFLDEPVSALDVSVQAQILNLLSDLRESLKLTYLFVSHDLRLVRHLCDRTAVMFYGQLVEVGPSNTLYDHPLHPYTRALRGGVLELGRGRELMLQPQSKRAVENLDSSITRAGGCRYVAHCPLARDICAREAPALLEYAPGHLLACHAQQEIEPWQGPEIMITPRCATEEWRDVN